MAISRSVLRWHRAVIICGRLTKVLYCGYRTMVLKTLTNKKAEVHTVDSGMYSLTSYVRYHVKGFKHYTVTFHNGKP